jgi:hypothetical protein
LSTVSYACWNRTRQLSEQRLGWSLRWPTHLASLHLQAKAPCTVLLSRGSQSALVPSRAPSKCSRACCLQPHSATRMHVVHTLQSAGLQVCSSCSASHRWLRRNTASRRERTTLIKHTHTHTLSLSLSLSPRVESGPRARLRRRTKGWWPGGQVRRDLARCRSHPRHRAVAPRSRLYSAPSALLPHPGPPQPCVLAPLQALPAALRRSSAG